MDGVSGGRRIAGGVLVFLVFSLFVLFAVASSSYRDAPEASTHVLLQPDWGNKWETTVKGVEYIPPAVTPSRKVVDRFARDIESPAIAEEVIRRPGLRMTPDELFRNLTVEPEPEGAFVIRLTYRDPTRESPQRARRIVRAVAVVAAERIRKETPYDYEWRLRQL